MIRFDSTITLSEARHAADILDCKLVQDGRGNIIITPRVARHTGSNVCKFPHKNQHQPEGPGAA